MADTTTISTETPLETLSTPLAPVAEPAGAAAEPVAKPLSDVMYPELAAPAKDALQPEDAPQSAEVTPSEEANADSGDKKEDEKSETPTELEYKLKVPEGSGLKNEHVAKTVSFAKEQGFSETQAQALLDRDSLLIKDSAAQFEAAQIETLKQKRSEWMNEIATDKELGLANLDATKLNIQRAMNRYGNPELKKSLNDTGLGNFKPWVKFVNSIGKAMASDTFIEGKTQVSNKKDLAELMYGNPPLSNVQ